MPNVVITRNTYPDDRALNYVVHYVLDKAVAVGSYGVSHIDVGTQHACQL